MELKCVYSAVLFLVLRGILFSFNHFFITNNEQ